MQSQKTSMQVTFWGVRGSIPTPLTPLEVEAKVTKMAREVVRAGITDPGDVDPFLKERFSLIKRGTIGGNTTCVSVEWPATTVIIDAGTGIRSFGRKLMEGIHGKGEGEVHLLMTHTHWDHIMGFPYFAPLFKNNTVHIYGVHPQLENRLRGQQQPEYYPVPLDVFSAEIIFHQIDEDVEYDLPGGGIFSTRKLNHPGDSYGYRIEKDGASVVMATDCEYRPDDNELVERTFEFINDVDLLIFDSQYTLDEAIAKKNWGHSTAVMGVKLAVEANVKRLALFHHEPNHEDDFICDILDKTREYKEEKYKDIPLDIFLAVEGLIVDL